MTRRGVSTRCVEAVRYVLSHSPPGSSCAGQQQHYVCEDVAVFLDFEHCKPNDQERPLFLELQSILEQCVTSLACLSSYGVGATAERARALKDYEDLHVQQHSFKVVRDFVRRMRKYYKLAQRIEQVVPNLLWELCSGPLPPAEHIESAQALCKQFAHLIDFVLSFDALKMNTPSLQNDFSFFKRVITRSEQSAIEAEGDCSLELANTISMFLASPTPMMDSLATATTAFLRDHPDLPTSITTETLATVVQIFHHNLENKEFYERFTEADRNLVMRVMVGVVVLFDHIDEDGAFCRESLVDIRGVVEVIKRHGNDLQIDQLMNALRYTTKHLNDTETPKSIKALFACKP